MNLQALFTIKTSEEEHNKQQKIFYVKKMYQLIIYNYQPTKTKCCIMQNCRLIICDELLKSTSENWSYSTHEIVASVWKLHFEHLLKYVIWMLAQFKFPNGNFLCN